MEPKLKPPGNKHLKLKCDYRGQLLLSNSILRRYTVAAAEQLCSEVAPGVYTFPLFSDEYCAALIAEVRWCKFKAQNSKFKVQSEREAMARVYGGTWLPFWPPCLNLC